MVYRYFTKIAGELIEAYSIIVSSNMYYFTMFAITVDRFLKIILNIRYPLYWKAKNTKTFLLIFFSILNGLYISYLSLVLIFAWHKMPLVMAKFYYSYIVPVFDITFVAVASGVYGYIFATIFKIGRLMNVCGNKSLDRLEMYHQLKYTYHFG